jgi:hypothetical protein
MVWKRLWVCMPHPNLLQFFSRVITEVSKGEDLPQEGILVRRGALLVTNRLSSYVLLVTWYKVFLEHNKIIVCLHTNLFFRKTRQPVP